MKAILVIDMPNRCIECPCGCYMRDGTVACGVIDLGTTEDSPRPEWCPLKPLPNEITKENSLAYVKGFQDAIVSEVDD